MPQGDELTRMYRVADMMGTCHSVLRDRYDRRALIIQLTILFLSAWVVAMSFADEAIAEFLNPLPFKPSITIGLLGFLAFVLTLAELKFSWKEKSGLHGHAATAHFGVKGEIGKLIATGQDINQDQFERVRDRFSSAASVPVPDRLFPALKRAHKSKVFISQYLDTHPAASIRVLKVRLWIRDSIWRGIGPKAGQ